MPTMRTLLDLMEARRPRNRWVPWLQAATVAAVETQAQRHFETPQDVQAVLLIWNALGGERAADFATTIDKAKQFANSAPEMAAIERVAPHLYDANLPDHALPTDNPAFVRWFAQSKVVDAEGAPLVVYHGTTSQITAFAKANLGWNTGAKSALGGFFFTSSAANAGEYAGGSVSRFDFNDYHTNPRLQNAQSGPNILPVYLSLQRPLVHDMQRSHYRDVSFNDLIRQAKRGKKDGVIIHNTHDPRLSTIYIAFRPEQIKSAIGSLYDPNHHTL